MTFQFNSNKDQHLLTWGRPTEKTDFVFAFVVLVVVFGFGFFGCYFLGGSGGGFLK